MYDNFEKILIVTHDALIDKNLRPRQPMFDKMLEIQAESTKICLASDNNNSNFIYNYDVKLFKKFGVDLRYGTVFHPSKTDGLCRVDEGYYDKVLGPKRLNAKAEIVGFLGHIKQDCDNAINSGLICGIFFDGENQESCIEQLDQFKNVKVSKLNNS